MNELERAADDREHAEREHVDLEEPQRFEVVLVPLDDAALGHRGVLHRNELGERPARDDETPDVLRKMTRKADDRRDELDEMAHDPAVGIEPGLAQALRYRMAAVPPRERFREAVDLRELEAQRLADVAHRAARPVADDRRRDRGAVAAVLFVDVLDDFLAPLVLEIDIDVRRLLALARKEALEEDTRASRIDFGDAEAVTHQRIRRGAASLAQYVFTARVSDDVVNGEEEMLVAQLCDQLELAIDGAAHVWRRAFGEAAR